MKLNSLLYFCWFMFFFVACFVNSIFSQNENRIWYLGNNNVGVSFDLNTQQPMNHNNHYPLEREGSAVATNENGDLLFYTDGIVAVNKNHEVMLGGNDLGACYSATQSTAIAKVPEVDNQYYIFSNNGGDQGCGESTIFYSRVDLNADNGLGTVIAMNVLLPEGAHQNMIIIPRPNSEDFWLIGGLNSPNFTHYSFLFKANGISEYEYEKHNLKIPSEFTHGSVWSPVQQKIAICSRIPSGIYTIGFNPLTGKFGAVELLDYDVNHAYDAEWSPDGSKLYYSSVAPTILRQYDFNTGSISELSSTEGRGGGLKLGPDNKIYYIKHEMGTALSIINTPNEAGFSCNFIENGFNTQDTIKTLNFPETLPNIPQYDTTNFHTGIINQYFSVTNICDNTITIEGINSLHSTDKVLIIQMQGALVDTTNTENFGKILDYRNAGKYEFNEVAEIEGNRILLKNQLENDYQIDQKVQVIRVPNLRNATVTNLTCKPWDGETGGVLAFLGDVITMEGPIDVSGKGFLGGEYFNTPTIGCLNTVGEYFPASFDSLAAFKGSGISMILFNLARGRGAYANGGGGGNNHNSGGGGGANFGKGGFGGLYTPPVCLSTQNGKGGWPIPFDALEPRIYMGGGGGAGHSNNGFGTSGGNGGGIIIANVGKIESNDFTIKANGADAFTNFNFPDFHDGGGGGGAGGSILINYSDASQPTLNIEVIGGKGTSVGKEHGHGGGGSGGILMMNDYPATEVHLIARGGFSGRGVDNKTNGATDGEAGTIKTNVLIHQPTTPYVALGFDSLIVMAECDGTATIQILPKGGNAPYSYSLNGTNWLTESEFRNVPEGVQSVWIRDQCWQRKDTILVEAVQILQGEIVESTFERCDSLAFIELFAEYGQEPYTYFLNEKEQDNPYFDNLFAGHYQWKIVDARTCEVTGQITLEDRSETFNVFLPADETIGLGTNIHLPVEVIANTPSIYQYNWLNSEGLDCTDCQSPISTPSRTVRYPVKVTDEYGCEGASSVMLTVRPVEAYIPNVFSPNDDGFNDYFYVQGNEVQINRIEEISVYSRWGNLLFQKNNMSLNEESEGWDGTFKNKKLPPQVCVYHTKMELFNGEILKINGTITIVK